MTPALLLVLGCSLGWAGFDVLRKQLTRRLEPQALVLALACGQAPLFLAWGLAADDLWVAPAYVLPGLLGLLSNLVANLLFMRAVQIAPLSTTIPMLSFTPAFAALLSSLLLREWLRPAQGAGILAVVLGALLITSAPAPAGAPTVAARRGPQLMMVVALLWSLGAVLDKYLLRSASPAAHATLQASGLALVLLGWLAARGQLGQLRSARRAAALLLLAMSVSSLSLALQLLAYQRVFVSVVEAVKRTIGMAASVLNGRLLWHEPVTLGKLSGVTLMSLGVWVLLR